MAHERFKRRARINSLLREVLSELIQTEVKDPRVRRVNITDVDVTGDLREARIYYVFQGDKREIAAVQEGLRRASGFLRRSVGQRIKLRTTPTLEFRIDGSLEYGARIERALLEIKERASDAKPGDDDGSET